MMMFSLMSVATLGTKVECTSGIVYETLKNNRVLLGGVVCFGIGYGTKKIKDWYSYKRKIERFERYIERGESKINLKKGFEEEIDLKEKFKRELRILFGVIKEEVKVPKGESKIVFYSKLVAKMVVVAGMVYGIVWLYRLGKVNSLDGLSENVIEIYGKSGIGRQDLLKIGRNMLRPSDVRLRKC